MASLIIVKPEPIVSVLSGGTSRVFSPDPKEAMVMGAATKIVVDYGAPITIDTAYAGYHNASANAQWAVSACDANGDNQVYLTNPNSPYLTPLGLGFPYHALMRGGPLTSRYFAFQFNTGGYYVGVIAVGKAFVTQWGQEFGAGRLIEDTGSAERLFGGGFGIDDGVAATGYQWTFGDLQPAELRQLFQLVKDRRTTRSVLVVEDPDQTDGLNERIHWGLFRKLDAYERVDPLNTKWSLQISDWA